MRTTLITGMISGVKIALVGKGGGGKTTLTELLAHALAAVGRRVTVLNADVNDALGIHLGVPESELVSQPSMGLEAERVHERVRGNNPHLAAEGAVTKSTPVMPGNGYFSLRWEIDPLLRYFGRRGNDGIVYLDAGKMGKEQVDKESCYHSILKGVGPFISHAVDGPQDDLLIDSTAGMDPLASGYLDQMDLVICAVRPKRSSVRAFAQMWRECRRLGVPVWAVGTSIENDGQLRWLHRALSPYRNSDLDDSGGLAADGGVLLTWFRRSPTLDEMDAGEREVAFDYERFVNEEALTFDYAPAVSAAPAPSSRSIGHHLLQGCRGALRWSVELLQLVSRSIVSSIPGMSSLNALRVASERQEGDMSLLTNARALERLVRVTTESEIDLRRRERGQVRSYTRNREWRQGADLQPPPGSVAALHRYALAQMERGRGPQEATPDFPTIARVELSSLADEGR